MGMSWRQPAGTIVQGSDRRYIVDKHGSLRVLDYQSRPVEVVNDNPPSVTPSPAENNSEGVPVAS